MAAPLNSRLLPLLLPLLLASFLALVPVGTDAEGQRFHRQKREWIVAPRKLYENHDYTGLESIARIRSDKMNSTQIFYYLTGPGVDQPPVGIFAVDRDSGFVKIYSILDREKIPFYHLKGLAKYADGTPAEKDIDMKIAVLDVNDNAPVVKAQQVGSVNESSSAGTVVMKVIATDADQENTVRSEIFYSIVEESNKAGMFFINSRTGEVLVRQNTLDRETQDTYTLMIKTSDMAGQEGGNTGTGEVTIKIGDINDNVPTLEKESYEGSVEENTVNVEVMRVKAVDMDLIHTDNWLAVYQIMSGNEAGYFSITTDSVTNEGIITIHKALDYEELKALNLVVGVSNKAAYSFGSGVVSRPVVPKGYPVKINVVNQKEGPRFQPGVKVVTISEDHSTVSINKIITNYAAIDSDTLQTATNVRYAKIKDDDNWLIIDEKTADIKLKKLPDRESKYLINGTYYAEIICITNDGPSKTATGTVAIQVEDFNDHCPELTTTTPVMCLEDKVIYVTAVDGDEFPNSAPFEFRVIEGSSAGKWTVEHLNETTAILRANIWPGTYKVAVEVKDQQGKSCDDVQVMDVVVCTCDDATKTCRSRSVKSAGLGGWGILLLLLGLLLLLLLPLLLLFCLCGGGALPGDFKVMPFDTKQQLISYHTEGQGEDKDIPLLQVPVEVDGGNINSKNIYERKEYLAGLGGAAEGGGGLNIFTTGSMYNRYNGFHHSGGQVGLDYMDAGMMTGQENHFSQYSGGAFDGMALSNRYLEEYYSRKSNHAALQSHQKDGLLVYDYEGRESPTGSVGCCSLLENDNDLSFLDDLGPKFKTLAEICHGSTLVTESVNATVSVSPPRPVSPVWPSSHTHIHTHSETIRDRDRVNINTINTSNVESGSSTVVQEQRITERAQVSAAPAVQTMLLQQPPMYYTSAPMYVVEPKPQMVLVAGGSQQAVGHVGQVGLSQGLVQVGGLQTGQGLVQVGGQGLMQVGGLQTSQGLVQVGGLQTGQGLVQVGGLQTSQGLVQVGGLQTSQGLVQVDGLQTGPGVVLVDRQVGVGGVTGPVGTLSRSTQVLVVENGSSGGERGASLVQGVVQAGGQASEIRALHGSTGSNKDFALAATPNLRGSQRVVVQRKKVSVTERNAESTTRA